MHQSIDGGKNEQWKKQKGSDDIDKGGKEFFLSAR